jgi:hypothetical protein
VWRTLLVPLCVLARCRAVQLPRKGVQSALDCRIQNAPPPLMPEKATSASVRPAAHGRPRIPPRSSARTARSPLVWLVPHACRAKTAGCWLVLTRAGCAKTAGSFSRALAAQKLLAAGSFSRALAAQKQVFCRQIPRWRRLVLAHADPTGIRLLSSSSTLVAVNSFDCPASPR